MKSLIAKHMRTTISAFMFLNLGLSYAQSVTAEHPIQYGIILMATDSLKQEVNDQIRAQNEIAIKATDMSVKFSVMEGWEDKYNAYLKKVDGYASALKAGTTLYSEGVRTLYFVNQLRKAVSKNPQGLFATAALSNLYVDVAADLFKTFRLLQMCVARGGEMNMMTGAERTEMLWMLDDTIHDLNKKLQRLSISISYFTLGDVKDAYLAKIIRPDHTTVAGQALNRWQRAAEVNRTLNGD